MGPRLPVSRKGSTGHAIYIHSDAGGRSLTALIRLVQLFHSSLGLVMGLRDGTERDETETHVDTKTVDILLPHPFSLVFSFFGGGYSVCSTLLHHVTTAGSLENHMRCGNESFE